MTAWLRNASAVVERLVRACPPASPRTRAWLLSGLLAINLVLVLLPAASAQRMELLGFGAWIEQLEADTEGTPANTYSSVVWGAVALLAVAQLLRPTPSSQRRWLWRLGWLSVALLTALIAFEESVSLKETSTASVDSAIQKLEVVPSGFHWLSVVAVPLAAPLAAAGWVLVTSQRGHPARALVLVVVASLFAGAIFQDADVLSVTNVAWRRFIEEGMELMGATALGVILIEMLASPDGAAPDTPRRCRRGPGRRAAALAVTAALLIVSAVPLLVTHHVFQDNRWGRGIPWSYTGPISLVEQRFRATHDNLRRIDVWVEIDGGASAEIFARLTPQGSDRPVRESRAEVRGARFSNATAAIDFEPIPDSGGTLYTLAVGVLSGPAPYVFLGMTGSDVIPEGAAVVSGAPTRYADDLAMRTTWSGRFIEGMIEGLYLQDPQRPEQLRAVTLVMFLWVFLVVAAWAGLSGRRPRFWRRFVWPSVLTSALITAGILVIALAFFAVLSPTRLP